MTGHGTNPGFQRSHNGTDRDFEWVRFFKCYLLPLTPISTSPLSVHFKEPCTLTQPHFPPKCDANGLCRVHRDLTLYTLLMVRRKWGFLADRSFFRAPTVDSFLISPPAFFCDHRLLPDEAVLPEPVFCKKGATPTGRSGSVQIPVDFFPGTCRCGPMQTRADPDGVGRNSRHRSSFFGGGPVELRITTLSFNRYF